MEQEITLIMPVEAIQPDSADYDGWEHKIQEYRREFLENGDTINGSRGLHHYEKIAGWLEQIKACEKDNNSYIGVPVTTFLAIRRDSPDDWTIVGNIEIRHHLNPALEELGGHIGYSVRPSQRRKGYAVSMLRQVLCYARTLGLKKVMLDCDKSNTGSLKIIQKCGGVHSKDILSEYKGRNIVNSQFWISLP